MAQGTFAFAAGKRGLTLAMMWGVRESVGDVIGVGPVANVFVYFGQSNLAGQAIIVLLLLVSLLAWTVMLGKFLDLRSSANQNGAFAKRLAASPSLLAVDPEFGRAPGFFAELTRAAVKAFHGARQGDLAIKHVENAVQRQVNDGANAYESKMVLLGTVVSGAPFMGLLGTVWGVMDAFGAIAGDQTASINALAPGVSGALLTTVAGLLVAIPAVFGFNFLNSRVKVMQTDLENFASTLVDRLELEAEEL